MLFQSGLRIEAFTIRVAHACPAAIEFGGCSLWRSLGTIQETDGRVPCRASRKYERAGWTSET